MRKLAVVVALIASLTLSVAVAEAYKTSEKEGRKFSRKYVRQETPFSFGRSATQHQCHRIGRQGVGYYRLFPRGVACLFSKVFGAGNRRACYLIGVAVKDGKRHIQAAVVGHVFPYHGDAADCDRGAPYPEWPPVWGGITGGPLRLAA